MSRARASPLALGLGVSLLAHLGGGAGLSVWGVRPFSASGGATWGVQAPLIPLLSADSDVLSPDEAPDRTDPPKPPPEDPKPPEPQVPPEPPPPSAVEVAVGNPDSTATVASAWIGSTESLDRAHTGPQSSVDQPELTRTAPDGGAPGAPGTSGAPASAPSEAVPTDAAETRPTEPEKPADPADALPVGDPLGVLPEEEAAVGAPLPREGEADGERSALDDTPPASVNTDDPEGLAADQPREGMPDLSAPVVTEATSLVEGNPDSTAPGAAEATHAGTLLDGPSGPSPETIGASGVAPAEAANDSNPHAPMPGEEQRDGDEPGQAPTVAQLSALQTLLRATRQLAIEALTPGFSTTTRGEDAASSVGQRPEAAAKPPAPPVDAQGIDEPSASIAQQRGGGASQPGVPGGDPLASGELSDRDSIAAAIRAATEVTPGQPLAAKGLDIKTVRPRFSHTTAITISPRSPVIRVFFGPNGRVQRHTMLRSSGHPDVDRPILDAIYAWSASGEILENLGKPGNPVEIWFDVKILL